jgi:hypothetical protein
VLQLVQQEIARGGNAFGLSTGLPRIRANDLGLLLIHRGRQRGEIGSPNGD